MKLLCLVLIALIGSTVASVDCSTFLTKDTCTDSTCKFDIDASKSTCVSKCATFNEADCAKIENSTNCASVAAACAPKVKCADANGQNAGACTTINANCVPVAAVATATCANKATSVSACDGKKANAKTCGDDATCVYAQGAFQSCLPDASKCTIATCDTEYCTKTATCAQKSGAGACPTGTFTDGQCTAVGCIFTSGTTPTCTSNCATACNSAYCTETISNCVSDNSKATTKCATFNTNATCGNAINCALTTATGTCTVKPALCTLPACDAGVCDKVEASPFKCNSFNCPTTANNCGADCSATVFSCKAKDATACATATAEANCTAAKSCTFTASTTGTCATVPSTNAVILAFSSLIAFFAMI